MTAREEFEAWLTATIGAQADLRFMLRDYSNGFTNDLWQAWQASRAAALEEAAKECEQMQKHFDTQDAIDAAEQCAMGIRALKD